MGLDISTNTFFKKPYLKKVKERFAVPPSNTEKTYGPESIHTHLKRLTEEEVRLRKETVTDKEREATLRGLGFDVSYPFKLSLPEDPKPIPRKISSVWVGDRVISDDLINNLQKNAVRVKERPYLREKKYKFNLFLSNASPEVYKMNVSKLRGRAPDVNIICLEEHPFFEKFKTSKYYPHYLETLSNNNGKGSNFSFSSDILRYRLLSYEGGIYMDVDDRLACAPGKLNLETSTNGLLLSQVVNNPALDMYVQFNTSVFGTHKDNPTLDAISEEIYQRFSNSPVDYRSRPNPETHPAQFKQYLHDAAFITGPDVFNWVIDREIPTLKSLKEIKDFQSTGFKVSKSDDKKISAATRAWLPFAKVVDMGGEHSWLKRR